MALIFSSRATSATGRASWAEFTCARLRRNPLLANDPYRHRGPEGQAWNESANRRLPAADGSAALSLHFFGRLGSQQHMGLMPVPRSRGRRPPAVLDSCLGAGNQALRGSGSRPILPPCRRRYGVRAGGRIGTPSKKHDNRCESYRADEQPLHIWWKRDVPFTAERPGSVRCMIQSLKKFTVLRDHDLPIRSLIGTHKGDRSLEPATKLRRGYPLT